MLKRIPSFITNKYLITAIGFFVWLLFFDRYDLISQYNLRQQLKHLRQDKQYYINEINNNNESINELKTNNENLEKFAREKYLMKRDGEDIFVIVEKK